MKFILLVAALSLFSSVASAKVNCVASIGNKELKMEPITGKQGSYVARINGLVFTVVETGINDKTQELYLAIDLENRSVVSYFSKVGGTLEDSASNSSISCK